MKRSATGIVVVAAALIASTGALAGDAKETAPAGDATKPAAPTPESAGKTAPQMIVVKDPQTGELRAPTAAEVEALAAATPAPKLATSGATTTVEKLLSGRVRAKLGPEYMRYSVVRKNPDGTLSFDCVPESKVDGALKASAPAAKATTAFEEK
ncbi:MAG: post-PEP-CTERM-1 domain-containing protein [Thermoanaerobaculia bacterium]